MRPLKVKVSVTLDNDIVEKLKTLAEEDDRSFSQYINLLLKNHLERYDASIDKGHKAQSRFIKGS